MRSENRRSAWAEINLGALRSNYRNIKALAGGADIIAAVKADAYGHGAVKVAWELVKDGVTYLAVATLLEAVLLREAGIKTPIVILSPAPRHNIKDLVDLNITTVVTSYTDALLLSEMAESGSNNKTPEIFIALDTGMGRIGFIYNEDSIAEIKKISTLSNIKIKGFLSHFASATKDNDAYTLKQLETFANFRSAIEKEVDIPNYSTLSGSGAILFYPEAAFDAVRPGLILFGLYPSEESKEKISLTPVMEVKSYIVYLKKVPAGFSVSYNSTFTTTQESLIASLPLGYADGIPRLLSNRGRVIVNGVYAPIIGNVCMDQTMIDVTHVPNVKEYDEVIIMGTQSDKTISADEIAEIAGTISHEIVTGFGLRLPKVYNSEY